MNAKNLALVAAAAFGMVSADAFACSIAAWNGGPSPSAPVPGRPTDATPVARYSGQCGLRSAAAAQFVTDTTPVAETTFRARFYVFTGLSAGSAQVYRARNAGGTQMIGVTYNRDTNQFVFNTSTGSSTIGSIAANRWYSVELNWNRAAGNMGVTVQGAASATAPVTATVTGVVGTDQIDDASLGWVSSPGAATGVITTDAYESRRSTAIGRLCRGDSNNDTNINVGDRVAITNEIFAGTLAAGQPDCNEDGTVNVGDRVCVTNIIFGAGVCPP